MKRMPEIMTPTIMEVHWAYDKAKDCGKRIPEIEKTIITNAFYSLNYAQKIIKGRWIEAENIIMTDPYHCFLYAKDVIKGKLPEKMHNMMILHGIENPNNPFVKGYFEFIK